MAIKRTAVWSSFLYSREHNGLFQKRHFLRFGESAVTETVEVCSGGFSGGVPYRHMRAGGTISVHEDIHKLAARVVNIQPGMSSGGIDLLDVTWMVERIRRF